MISWKSAGFKILDLAYLRISKEISSTIPRLVLVDDCPQQDGLLLQSPRYNRLVGPFVDQAAVLWWKPPSDRTGCQNILLEVSYKPEFQFLVSNSIEVRICFFSLRFTSPPASCPGDKLEISALGLCTSSVSLSVKFQFFLYWQLELE